MIAIIFVLARLRVGDELRMKIAETEAVDKPRERFPLNATAEEIRKKRSVMEMAQQFGLKILGVRRDWLTKMKGSRQPLPDEKSV
jgi:hypothetical protein